MMVHFRKRFPSDFINRVNEMMMGEDIYERLVRKIQAEKDTNGDDDEPRPPAPTGGGERKQDTGDNKGKLMLDATVAPADIRYPNDLSLLNESRENLELIIEELWQSGDRKGHKTGYGRKKARKEYLSITKQKKPRIAKIRKVVGRQLVYVRKDIETIGRLLARSGVDALSEKRIKRIMTICEVHRQQERMYKERGHACENRIVSLKQPHIRPMVRGKAGKPYEFGQKVSAAVVDGYVFIDRQSYDGFHEGVKLIESVEQYRERFGFYPEAVLADTIYRNRTNLSYCKEHSIRLSGPRLGRPKAKPTSEEKSQAYRDSSERNMIEGRFGIGKRRYGLGLVMAYLPETGLTEVALKVLCMNVALKMKKLLSLFLSYTKYLFVVVSADDFLLFSVE